MHLLYHRYIIESGRQPQFLMLTAFIVTVVSVRGIAHSIRMRGPGVTRNVVVRGVHVHHFVWGISLLLLSGYLSVALPEPPRGLLAVLFGCGAALTLDEFALWIHLEDVYWSARGRRSIEVVAGTAAVLALFMMHVALWVELFEHPIRFVAVHF